MKNKKKIILGSIIGVFIGLLIGTTYAIFSYSQIGGNEQLITGDIYMHYKESNELTISNALPSNTYDPNKYFEFTIDGKNTNTLYDIYYDINLLRGAVPDGKTESNRIQDKFIKFRLTEFINGVETEIFTNKSFSDLSSSKRVHVDTISKNTNEKVTHTYRLYMWISDSVVIGNTENPDKDYDITTWNNLFASIKVSSTGDFEEKEIEKEATDASCFTTAIISGEEDGIQITGYEVDQFYDYEFNENLSSEEVQTCVNYLTEQYGPEEEGNTVDPGETYRTFCEGTGTWYGLTFQDTIDYGGFGSDEVLRYFFEHNIISKVVSGGNCSADVVIPKNINGQVVKKIGSEAFRETWIESVVIPDSVTTIAYGAFRRNALESVIIPNSVTTIDTFAFKDNGLTSIEIPDSVIRIGEGAFNRNPLTHVTIGDNVERIESNAFTVSEHYGSEGLLNSVTIPSSVNYMDCTAFDVGVEITYTNPSFTCSN